MGDRCASFRLVEKESGQKLIALEKKKITGALVIETVQRQVFCKRHFQDIWRFGNQKIRELIF